MTKLKAGVIGYPLGHSLSPLIHNYWASKYNIEAHYDAVQIEPGEFHTSVKEMVQQGYAGFNVTLPYKEKVKELCVSLSESAREIGAVNTVVIDKDGAFHGMNTDAFGFVENVKCSCPDFEVQGKKALVIGAGGAARAIIYGLQMMGFAQIEVTNRTKERAEEIAEAFPFCSVVDWEEKEAACKNTGFLVNTTSLGMTGQPELEMKLDGLPPQALVCDIVYKPLHTKLLREAASRGNAVVTGIGMLIHQARPAFQEWFGIMPEVDQALLDKIEEELK